MKILDATAGYRGIWYQKNHPFVTFMDKRKETVDTRSDNNLKNSRRYKINPDVVSEWKDAPFPDNYFDMIVFDPPHLAWVNNKKESSLDKAYGYFKSKDECKRQITEGVNKLFKILKPEGIFILKWCENSIPIDEIIKLMPYQPLFGSNTKSKGHTANYWIVFLKYDVNMKLTEIQT